MGYSTTSVRPPVTVAQISDLAVANAGMDLIEQDGLPLQSMPLDARRVIVRLGSAAIVYHSTDLRVRTRTRPHPGLLAFVTFGSKAKGTVEGIKVRPGLMIVAEPETSAEFYAEPGYESVALLVAPDELRRHLTARGLASEFRWPHRVEVLHTSPVRARRIFVRGKRLATWATRLPSLFDEGRPERSIAQDDMLEALLAAMCSAGSVEPVGRDRTRRTYSRIVRLAVDYLTSKAGERVHVSDLCRIADVSERTIESAFKEVSGLTPLAYLNRFRLARVRAALLEAPRGSTLVSREALKWGFWHFGEFSRAYKQCFGESPSDTLRREPTV